MIKPTVGRVLWYWPGKGSLFALMPGQPLAATVAAVWSDTCVNIGFLDSNGFPQNETSVQLWQGEDSGVPRPLARFCEWMPMPKITPVAAPSPTPADAPAAIARAAAAAPEMFTPKTNTLHLKGKK